jgi:hypothetical protein
MSGSGGGCEGRQSLDGLKRSLFPPGLFFSERGVFARTGIRRLSILIVGAGTISVNYYA